MSGLGSYKRQRKKELRAQKRAMAKESLREDFRPIMNNVNNKIGAPIRNAAKRHPKKTLAFMIIVIVANMAILYFYQDDFTFSGGAGQSDLSLPEFHSNFKMKNDFHFSLGEIMEVSKIKGSLGYLMNKKQLTKKDSLLFIRLSEKMSKIDTSSRTMPNANFSTKKNIEP